MTEKRAKRSFSVDFKREAVALVIEQGYSVSKAAEVVGVTSVKIYKRKEKLEAQTNGAALADDERENLKRLRKEVREPRMEKEILKKASALFIQTLSSDEKKHNQISNLTHLTFTPIQLYFKTTKHLRSNTTPDRNSILK